MLTFRRIDASRPVARVCAGRQWRCLRLHNALRKKAFDHFDIVAFGDSWTEQLEQLERSLSMVARVVNGVYEVAFGKEAAALEPAPDLRGLSPLDANTFFIRATKLYREGDYAEALASLRTAVALRNADARYWSFKALAERALGQRAAAVASARKALDLRKQDLPDPATFGEALERVQGAERRFLNAP